MVLQVRVTDPDGSNPIILDGAKSRKVSMALNSDDDGGSFTIAKNDSKANILNPDQGGYTKLWEIWDTETNERLNFGPITTITENGPNWSIQGKGRATLFADYIDSRKTFYARIDTFVDELRYENIAIEPKTTTLVPKAQVTADQTTVFGSVTVDEKYAGLSKNVKDNVIDNLQTRPGEIEPPNTYYTIDSFWAGMSKNDAIIVDLGEVFPIDRITVRFPWWGGIQRLVNRSYDWSLAVANDTDAPTTDLQGRTFGPFTTIFNTGSNSPRTGPNIYNLGSTNSGIYFGAEENLMLSEPGPVDLRYIRVNISDVNAWWGDDFGTEFTLTKDWARQCDPNEVGGFSEGIEIDDRTLKPNSDCYASVVEIGAFKQIIGRDRIKPLALQRIDNDNLQISYYHVPDSSEIVTTSGGFREFEPGGFFRRFTVSWSGANTTYTKFFNSDCTNCYPDGFNFGVADQNNNLVYHSDNASGTATRTIGAYTSKLLLKGSSTATITYADAWPSRHDPLSWGAQYSYTEEANDYAVVHFRGQSFRWFATIPSGKTGATVKIEIRNQNSAGNWTSWTTLENSYALPNNISASKVYEITYESGYLQSNTTYEIKITNLDGGYCSIDSFEGYWAGSMTSYNDDSSRIFNGRPERTTQIYDGRFSNGTMTKFNKQTWFGFSFHGDRVILLSAKGRNHGKLGLYLFDRRTGPFYYGHNQSGNVIIPIPGGEPDGGLLIDLDTGKRGAEIPQYVAFDSQDYFPSLSWGRYYVQLYLRNEDIEQYSANIYDTNNFVSRCEECRTSKGTQTINKYVYLDSFIVHEAVGLSVSFETKTHLEMLKSVAEAIQSEWDITDNGVVLDPRIGEDTNVVLREGHSVVVDYNIVNDTSKVASMLFSSGADIDGLPLTTVTEDRLNRQTLGRTVMRIHDFRDNASYLQLIGLSRMELRKRRYPEKRMTVKYTGDRLGLNKGDSFLLYTKKMGSLRVRIDHIDISEESGREYSLEVSRWPRIE